MAINKRYGKIERFSYGVRSCERTLTVPYLDVVLLPWNTKQFEGEHRMKRKTRAFLLALTVVLSIAGVSLAEFDYSVFEDNENFEVGFNVMDATGNINTGNISIAPEFLPVTTFTVLALKKVVMAAMDIYEIQDLPTLIRLRFLVVGYYPNTEKVTFVPDKTRYTIETESSKEKAEGGTPYEVVNVPFTDKIIPMLDEIVEKQITTVKYSLDADNDIDGELTIKLGNLKTLLDLYKAAGGLKQEFAEVNEAFPVTVK